MINKKTINQEPVFRKDFLNSLSDQRFYRILKDKNNVGLDLFYREHLLGRYLKNNEFYRFLKEEGVQWNKIISEKIEYQSIFILIKEKNIYHILLLNEDSPDFVEEKLMLSDFEKKQTEKLVKPLGLKLEYVYVLNDWFKKKEYKDVLDYIESVNCHYKFNELPLAWLGLPVNKK